MRIVPFTLDTSRIPKPYVACPTKRAVAGALDGVSKNDARHWSDKLNSVPGALRRAPVLVCCAAPSAEGGTPGSVFGNEAWGLMGMMSTVRCRCETLIETGVIESDQPSKALIQPLSGTGVRRNA